jgi:hypothetical protein
MALNLEWFWSGAANPIVDEVVELEGVAFFVKNDVSGLRACPAVGVASVIDQVVDPVWLRVDVPEYEAAVAGRADAAGRVSGRGRWDESTGDSNCGKGGDELVHGGSCSWLRVRLTVALASTAFTYAHRRIR